MGLYLDGEMLARPKGFSNAEFAYWLQGAVEIGEMRCFSRENYHRVLERLAYMREVPDEFTRYIRYYVERLNNFLEDKYFQEAFDKVYPVLQSKFIHDIDPSYEGDQAHFNTVHRGASEPMGAKP